MRYFFYIVFFLMLSTLLCVADHPQKLHFTQITTQNGLNHNSVNAIIQDASGYIWFGTENGLHRYDGIDIKIFTHDVNNVNSISGNVIYALVVDKKNDLWIATNSGFNRYREESGDFERIGLIPQNDSQNTFYSYYVPAAIVSPDGSLFISHGNNGIYKYNPQSNLMESYSPINKSYTREQMGNIIVLFVDSDNTLWMGSRTNGVFKHNLKTLNTTLYQRSQTQNLLSPFIFSINEDRYGRILISGNNGICIYDRKTDALSAIGSNALAMQYIQKIWNIQKDNHGNLWFCSNGKGLHKVIDRHFNLNSYFPNERQTGSLNDNNIQCFLEDRQGNIWIGTQRGGVNVAINNNASVFNSLRRRILDDLPLTNERVSAICAYNDTIVIIGADGGGINAFDYKNNKLINVQKLGYNIKPSTDAILTLYIDSKRNLWAGGFLTGIIKYHANNGIVERFFHDKSKPESIPNNDVRHIYRDSSGRLWIATNGGGICIIDDNGNVVKSFLQQPGNPNTITSNYALIMREDNHGYLWVGTYEGLTRIKLNSFEIKRFGASQNLLGEWVYSLFNDSRNQFWVGTNMAIHKFNYHTEEFENYLSVMDLPNEIVAGIAEDTQGNLWVGTSNGLARFIPGTQKNSRYFELDGLPGNSFNNGPTLSLQGNLFFGTSQGLLWFNPKFIKENTFPPVVLISDFYAAGKEEPVIVNKSTKNFTINYKQAASVTFHFAALNFINATQNNYSIKLEGLDNEWKSIGNKKYATYTNLSPGRYKFRVIAGNNDNVWNETGDYISLIVTPPFWKTNFAYFIYSLLIIMFLSLIWRYSFIRFRYAEKLRIEKLKVAKANEIAKIKTDFLLQVSHELSTPLTLILGPVEKLLPKNPDDETLLSIIKKNALQMLTLVNELIDSQKIEENKKQIEKSYGNIVQLTNEIINRHQAYAEKSKVNVKMHYEHQNITFLFDINAIDKVISNILLNAIKYNVDNGSVDVKIWKEDTTLKIAIEDTGIGIDKHSLKNIFNKYYRVPNSSPKSGFGIGLYISKRLIELHEGTIIVSSEINKGTLFQITLPLAGDVSMSQQNASGTSNSQSTINAISIYSTDYEHFRGRRKLPLILIAEDNEDICRLLKSIMEHEFSMIFAQNGYDAIEKANKVLPDLIIADIMMPKMDGIQFCRQIKSDNYLSHIPVVVLTALNTGEMMLNGLNAGADDYISKPFNPEILLVRIKNIIQTRKFLQKRFLSDIKTRPSELALTTSDNLFLDKLISLIETYMENPELKSELLAAEMNMSQITLYRKIKSLTGQSINPFIRTVRLKKAAALLESKTMNISDVASLVGFSDIKYFRKCFFKQFGMLPSQIKTRVANEPEIDTHLELIENKE